MAPVDKVLQLDPSKVLAEDNIRFSLLAADVEDMERQILDRGEVQIPVEVESLDPPQNGFTHKLTYGFKRHAALLKLNKEKGAGLTLPALLRPTESPLDRMKRQITENVARKSMSPMDMAVTLKRLLDAEVPRLDIRTMFGTVNAKGEAEPKSNSWLNMTVSFLELPKDIQKKIHSGAVGVKAAYKLTKVSPEKRAEVLEAAEAEVERERKAEAAEEEKWLKAEKSVEETKKASEDAAAKLDEAKAEVELAEKAVDEATKKATTLYQKTLTAKGDDKKKAEEAAKAAKADAVGAEKKLTTAQKALKSLTEKSDKLTKKAEENRKKLEDARKAAAAGSNKKGAGVSERHIEEAAKKSGETTGPVALNAGDMRKSIADLALPGTPPKVQAIAKALKDHFAGESTPGELLKALCAVTGEKAPSSRKAK